MLVKKITFPSPLEYIEDVNNDNIDVFVELEDGYEYTYIVVVATPKNLVSLMDKKNSDFLETGHPFIIVRKLTKEIIEKAIKAHAENDAYWLKLHHFSGRFDSSTFNKLRAEHMEELKELDEFYKLDNP